MRKKHDMPAIVRQAISKRAHRIATTIAYAALKQELEARAADLLQRHHNNPQQVVCEIDSIFIDYGPRSSLQVT